MTNEQLPSETLFADLRTHADWQLAHGGICRINPDVLLALIGIAERRAAHEPRACLCDESLALLRKMRDEHIERGSLSGRLQHEAENHLQKLASRATQPPPVGSESVRSIQIPTAVMEQEFQSHYRLGYEAGKRAAQPPDPVEVAARARFIEAHGLPANDPWDHAPSATKQQYREWARNTLTKPAECSHDGFRTCRKCGASLGEGNG